MTKATASGKTAASANADTGGNPFALVAGGVAFGAVVGMLVPRFEKERELLDPIGAKLADRATSAIDAAKEAGKAELEALIPGRDSAKYRAGALVGNVIDAAKSAATQKA